jgi:hypothetical protein
MAITAGLIAVAWRAGGNPGVLDNAPQIPIEGWGLQAGIACSPIESKEAVDDPND